MENLHEIESLFKNKISQDKKNVMYARIVRDMERQLNYEQLKNELFAGDLDIKNLSDIKTISEDIHIAKMIDTIKIGNGNNFYYKIFVNKKRLQRIKYTFDEALIEALAYKYDKCNIDTGSLISRMLNIKS